MLLGRGHAVAAETIIKNSVMKKVLKIDPDVLFEAWPYYPTISSMAGIHGNGIHESNALTAIYLATLKKVFRWMVYQNLTGPLQWPV